MYSLLGMFPMISQFVVFHATLMNLALHLIFFSRTNTAVTFACEYYQDAAEYP